MHFFALGAALFALYAVVGGPEDDATRIVVSAGQIESLAATFARTWQRPPTPRELDGLIADHVREEVYAREAAALGLDRDDTVVRRRLRQKMEFLTEEAVAPPAPTDDELRAYLAQHAERFRVEPRVELRQVFVSPARRGERAEADARALLERLNAAGPEADVSGLGDATLLPADVPLAPRSEIARSFGDEFAASLADGAPGRWFGPIGSPYGLHLVLIRQHEAGRLPALDEVREQVTRDWTSSRRDERLETTYRTLLERYTVVIERPGGTTG